MQSRPGNRGANAERFRAHNRRLVLGHLLAQGAAGRAALARRTGLSTQAVSNIIADLTAEGLIRESGRVSVGRGTPVAQYSVDPRGGHALGIELRPDAVIAGLADLEGHLRRDARRDLDANDPATVAGAVQDLAAELLPARPGKARLIGAGVVMPGPFGATGLPGTGAELRGWEGIDPQAHFAAALGMDTAVENDANAAALAERLSGAAVELHSFACLYFGSGLGLGLVSQGRLVPGAFGNAGEIGQLPVPDGVGGLAPLEMLASRLSLARALADSGRDGSRIEALDALHRAGDDVLAAWLDRAAAALGHAVHVIETLTDPQGIILSGALPPALIDALIARIQLAPGSIARRADNPVPPLQRGRSGRLTAVAGAAALILDRNFAPAAPPAAQGGAI